MSRIPSLQDHVAHILHTSVLFAGLLSRISGSLEHLCALRCPNVCLCLFTFAMQWIKYSINLMTVALGGGSFHACYFRTHKTRNKFKAFKRSR